MYYSGGKFSLAESRKPKNICATREEGMEFYKNILNT